MEEKKETEIQFTTPIEMHEFLDNAIDKKLIPTLEAIKGFCTGSDYFIELKYLKKDQEEESIKNFNIVLTKTERGEIEFKIILPELLGVGGVLHKESYGVNKELNIFNKSEKFRVKTDSVTDFSTEFPYVPQILNGQFTQINEITKTDFNNVYLRLVISSRDKQFKSPLSILQRDGTILCDEDSYNSHQSIMGFFFKSGIGYTDLTVNGKSYHYYSINNSTIIIDCLDKTDLSIFKLDTRAIQLAFSFLSGNLYQGQEYYISSLKLDFEEIEGIWYERGSNEIISKDQIINPTFFFGQFERQSESIKSEWKPFHKMFDPEIFQSISDKILSTPEFKRCIELLVNAGANNAPVQKGAQYSVCVETLADLIGSENEDSFKPIPKEKKAIWKQLLQEMKESLEKTKDSISHQGYEILTTKIENLNSPTNRDKLEKPFKLLGINLSQHELDALNQRNRYLHGDKPDDRGWNTATYLNALKLHNLIGMLILKYFDYSGHFINVAALYLLGDGESQNVISQLDFNELEIVIGKIDRQEINSTEELEHAQKVIQNYHRFNIAALEIDNLIRIL